MICPYCRHPDSRVVDSRTSDGGAAIRRRRQCTECGRRFSTVETTSVSVIKRSGVTEPFNRQKIISGVRKACQGRPVSQDDLAKLAQEVEERIRARGLAEIDAHEVGLTILEPLSKLDTVAFLRFASVYQAFDNLEDFEKAIADLRKDRVDTPAPVKEEESAEERNSPVNKTVKKSKTSSSGEIDQPTLL